jgi:prepilin-type N-terminal cleavage/methylation domain-containing protein
MKLKPFATRQARDISLKKGNFYGFTLIEIVVVLGVLGLIMVSVFSVLNGAFKTNNRVKWSTRVEQTGTFILDELKRNILNADVVIPCGVGTSVSFNNINDGNTTTIICTNGTSTTLGGISSSSANLNLSLSGNGVSVFGCDNFVTCDTIPFTGKVADVNFNFNLGAGTSEGGPEDRAIQNFQSKITIRN